MINNILMNGTIFQINIWKVVIAHKYCNGICHSKQIFTMQMDTVTVQM